MSAAGLAARLHARGASGARTSSRAGLLSLTVFLAYLLLSFVYYGVPLLVERGSQYVGVGADPSIFIWSFAWWPHAIAHGQNPFYTHAVWAPQGVNLAWATSVPALAIAFAPLTVIWGPIAAYNAACIVLPALAAWSAFRLCRYLTRSLWPSLVGGYLFGFCSYIVEHTGAGHLNLVSVFLLPLAALVSLRFLNGEIGERGLVLRLGPLFAVQLLLSTEIELTLAIAFVVAIAFGYLFVPLRRPRLPALVRGLLAAYALGAVLTAPFVYYLLSGFRSAGFAGAPNFVADLLNFIVPTNFSLVGEGPATALARVFPNLSLGQEAYIGVPSLVLVGCFAWRQGRARSGRFLLACLAVALLATLGSHLDFSGNRLAPLPYDLLRGLPLLDNVETVRLSSFVALLVAVIAALWMTSSASRELRILLPTAAVLALAADPTAGAWARSYHVPAFFTHSAYATCLDPGENILPLPIVGQGDDMLWEAESGFRFSMAGGDLGPVTPKSFLEPPAIKYVTDGYHLDAAQTANVRAFIAKEHITTAVVAQNEIDFFSGALDPLAKPTTVGGVVLYHFSNAPPSC